MNFTFWNTFNLRLGLYWRILFGRRTNKRYPCVTCGLPYNVNAADKRIGNEYESPCVSKEPCR